MFTNEGFAPGKVLFVFAFISAPTISTNRRPPPSRSPIIFFSFRPTLSRGASLFFIFRNDVSFWGAELETRTVTFLISHQRHSLGDQPQRPTPVQKTFSGYSSG